MKRVVAAIIEENGKILIARRAPGQSHASLWEFPGGKIEPGETPEQSLAREIQEELGLEIAVGAFFGSNVFPYKDFTIELLAYRARRLGGTLAAVVHDEVRFVLPSELAGFQFTPADVPFVTALQEGA